MFLKGIARFNAALAGRNLTGLRSLPLRHFAVKATAADVKALRERTGAPMMDCKKALEDEEVNGDIDLAYDWLRKRGVAIAQKKSDRSASQGLIGLCTSDDERVGAAVEVNSETDFVGRNELFQGLVERVAQAALKSAGSVSFETVANAELPGGDLTGKPCKVAEGVTDLIGKVGENLVFRRATELAVKNGLIAT